MEIEREIRLEASSEEVWESLADAGWLGPDALVELRPAGEVRCGERRGFVEEVDAPRRLVFWWSAPDEESSRVELELEEDGEATVVRVVESRPMAVLDLRGVEAVTGAPRRTTPEMSAALALR